MPPRRKPRAKKKETPPPWNEDHPARALLYQELANNNIPVGGEAMSADEVWETYKDTIEFTIPGMDFDDTFKRRLQALRDQVEAHRERAQDDRKALAACRQNYPPTDRNHRNEPHWNGSRAQNLLEEDLQDDAHLNFDDKKFFWQSRDEYQEFPYKIFRGHVHQAIRTRKYLHTLRVRGDEKYHPPPYLDD